jgi:hypothetical protein
VGTSASYPTTPRSSLAPGHGSPSCDLVTVPARQGLEAVDILRWSARVGPVLHDHLGETLGFLVPGGTAAAWDLPGSACTGAAEPPSPPSAWLLPPHGTAPYTDPAHLRDALGQAAVTIAAADGVQPALPTVVP